MNGIARMLGEVRGCLAALALALALVSAGQAQARAVQRVVDGDTVRLSGGDSVRLIGINAPELHHPRLGAQPGGQEAKDHLQDMVEGKDLRLEYDVERYDRYGRTLAYLWLDGKLVNLQMVSDGYATAYTVPPNVKYENRFRDAETEAREASRGLWAHGAIPGLHDAPGTVIPRRDWARSGPDGRRTGIILTVLGAWLLAWPRPLIRLFLGAAPRSTTVRASLGLRLLGLLLLGATQL